MVASTQWLVLYGSFLIGAANYKVLPVLFRYLEEDLKLGPTELGATLGCQGICHVTAVAFFGYVAVFVPSRIQLVGFCAALWALGTLSTAWAIDLQSLQLSRAVIGLSSGVVGPVSQVLIAEWVPPSRRGRSFGCVTALDSMGQTFATSSIACLTRVLQSWRPSLVLMASLTAAFSLFAMVAASKEPHREIEYKSAAFQATRLLRNRTLLVVVVQGFFASTQLQALAFINLWLQQCGFSELEAATLFSLIIIGNLFSCLLGGWSADLLAARYPEYGRIGFGLAGDSLRIAPLLCLFAVGPSGRTVLSGVLCFVYGLTQSLAYVGSVRPLCSEAVSIDLVGPAIAVAATVDGAFAAIAGGPLVGWFSEHLFGYQAGAFTQENLAALQRALEGVLLVSSVGTVLCFSMLCLTFPGDRRRALARPAACGKDCETPFLAATTASACVGTD